MITHAISHLKGIISGWPGQSHGALSGFCRARKVQHSQLTWNAKSGDGERLFEICSPCILADSSSASNLSRNSIMVGSVSKSVKWLFTHSNNTRVTLSLSIIKFSKHCI